MLRRVNLLVVVALGTSCWRTESPAPVIVHVLRDPSSSFARKLGQADLQFGLTKPHLKNGKVVMVATNEGNSFQMLLRQFTESPPDLLILDSQAELPDDAAIRKQVGKAEPVCGQHPAFIPTSASSEYERPLKCICDS